MVFIRDTVFYPIRQAFSASAAAPKAAQGYALNGNSSPVTPKT